MSTNPFAKKPDASKTGKNMPGKPGDKPDSSSPSARIHASPRFHMKNKEWVITVALIIRIQKKSLGFGIFNSPMLKE